MPVLPGIIAKILALVEEVLDTFVTVNISATTGACDIDQYNTFMQTCGDDLVTQLSQMIYAGVDLVANIISALTAVPL
jgi:hypothetical protein